MQAKVNTSVLEKVLKKIEGVADKKASMAVLSMVLVEPDTEEGTIHFTATDLETGYKAKVPAELEGDAIPFCVPARKFYEIVKNFPEEEILFIKDENRLIVKDAEERIIYNLATTESEDFPSLPEFSEENAIEIQGKTLEELDLASNTGVWIIAIRRGKRWIFAPEGDVKIFAHDVLIGRGTQTSMDYLKEIARGIIKVVSNE